MEKDIVSAKRMENIYINHFAGLKNVSIDMAPITVMIGPQASGKSVTAKLIYFFRDIGSQLQSASIAGKSVDDFRKEYKKKFCLYFPTDSWPARAFQIVYKNNGQELKIEYQASEGKQPEESLSLHLSEFYTSTLTRFSERWSQLVKGTTEGDIQKTEEARAKFRAELFSVMDAAIGKWSKFQQIFIPAGRAFFSQLETGIFTTILSGQEAGQSLDPFLVSFGSFFQDSKNILYERRVARKPAKGTAPSTRFLKVFSEILQGDFKRSGRKDYLRYSDGRNVRLAQASSGQQEVLPLLLTLGRFHSLSHVAGRAVYIEEPEAHLFPSTQRKIIEYMAETFRERPTEMCLCMTTHSPYVLTSLNNLIQAGKMYKTADEAVAKKISAIVPRSIALSPSEVTAYSLHNGESTSIICRNTELIDAEIIDKVSEDIAVKFDQLLGETC